MFYLWREAPGTINQPLNVITCATICPENQCIMYFFHLWVPLLHHWKSPNSTAYSQTLPFSGHAIFREERHSYSVLIEQHGSVHVHMTGPFKINILGACSKQNEGQTCSIYIEYSVGLHNYCLIYCHFQSVFEIH